MKNSEVSKLAKELGVSEDQLLSFANLVVSELKRDKVNMDRASSEVKKDVVQVYTNVAVERFSKFSMAVKHNDGIRNQFSEGVLATLR